MNCPHCQKPLVSNAPSCTHCGSIIYVVPASASVQEYSSVSRVVYILLAIFLGTLGVHNFVAGHWLVGLLQFILTVGFLAFAFLFTLLTLGFGGVIFMAVPLLYIWPILDICFVKKDADGKPFLP